VGAARRTGPHHTARGMAYPRAHTRWCACACACDCVCTFVQALLRARVCTFFKCFVFVCVCVRARHWWLPVAPLVLDGTGWPQTRDSKQWIRSIAYSPDGLTLAVGSTDKVRQSLRRRRRRRRSLTVMCVRAQDIYVYGTVDLSPRGRCARACVRVRACVRSCMRMRFCVCARMTAGAAGTCAASRGWTSLPTRCGCGRASRRRVATGRRRAGRGWRGPRVRASVCAHVGWCLCLCVCLCVCLWLCVFVCVCV
jgi:hypothetical protein